MLETDVEAEDPENATLEEKVLIATHATVSEAAQTMHFLKLDAEHILKLAESKAGKARGEAYSRISGAPTASGTPSKILIQ